MHKKEQTVLTIADLLSKFLSDTMISTEKGELYECMMDDCQKKKIMVWLQQQWDNETFGQTEDNDFVLEVPSEKMFSKIKEKITSDLSVGKNLTIHKKPSYQQKFNLFMRYAAIFAIAFGLSWIIQKKISHPVDDDVVVIDAVVSLQYNEILVPFGSKTKVVLPDSTTVWLNSGSRLKYPAQFDSNNREIFLQGEGFFDVSHDSLNPFFVNSNGINIKVLGTRFNLMANAGDKFIETTLLEGTIEIMGLKDATTQSNLVLRPGQKLTLHKKDAQFEIATITEAGLSIPEEATESVIIKNAELYEKTNVDIATAWTENRLVFVRERFADVKIKLERWYGVTIEVKDPEILEYRFTGTFEKQTLEQAMNSLSKAASSKFTIDKNHVIVSK